MYHLNFKILCNFPKQYICQFHVALRINSNFFLDNIDWLVFAMKFWCVFCEVRTDSLSHSKINLQKCALSASKCHSVTPPVISQGLVNIFPQNLLLPIRSKFRSNRAASHETCKLYCLHHDHNWLNAYRSQENISNKICGRR
jgi:hypothetical protein